MPFSYNKCASADADSPSLWGNALNNAMSTNFEVENFEPRGRAILRSSKFGAGEIYSALAPSQVLAHINTRSDVDGSDSVYIIQIRNGGMEVKSNGRAIFLADGSCTLVDSRLNFRLSSNATTNGLIVRLPERWLESWLTNPDDYAAQEIKSDTGWGKSLCSLLLNLDPMDAEQLGNHSNSLSEHIALLLSLSKREASHLSEGKNRSKIREILSMLETELSNINLSPELISERLGVSKRHLHYQFAACGTTFSKELLDIRLKHAYKLLSDGATAKSVLEIAMTTGFCDSSHFSKKFREKYGVPPKKILHGID
uniref:Probable transcriptional regulator n=1 Tax=Pseudomonas putida TaxID=303 RepID=A5HV12_PSEPU|nr:probable transcriptional regulator [Pseudomonas putida]